MKQTKQFMQHLLLMLVVLMSAASAKAANYDFKAENSDGVTIYYKVNGDNATVVAGDEKYTGSVNIPETVTNEGNVYSITALGNSAFAECKNLLSVSVPSTVITLGTSVFFRCGKLETVQISGNITIIPSDTFYGCTKLNHMKLPESVTKIGSSAFCYCTILSDINIPHGLTSIGSHAFFQTSIKELHLPSTLSYIGKDAFYDCRQLVLVSFPESITECGSEVFGTDTNIAMIYVTNKNPIPLTADCFYSATKKYATLYIPKGTKDNYKNTEGWDFSNVVEYEEEWEKPYIFSKENEEGVLINYVAIGNRATVIAKDEKYVNDIKIPEIVTNLGNIYTVVAVGGNAFEGCKDMTSLYLPSTVSLLGFGSFSGCSKLSSLSIPPTITNIPENLFSGCSKLRYCELPNQLVSIGASSFYGCTSLVSIDLPNSVRDIGSYAFSHTALYTITIPSAVKSIGNGSFSGITTLKEVLLPSTIEKIGKQSFWGSTQIESIICKIFNPFEITDDVFQVKDQATLYVPFGTKTTYQNTRGWEFDVIVEMEQEKLPITLTANLQTFCSVNPLDFTGVEGLKAYIASGFSPSTGEVIMSSVNIVPAKTGLLLVGTAGQEYEVPFAETDFIYSNLFRGLIEDVEVTRGYVLSGNEFVAVNDAVTVKGGEAYLNVTSAANAPRLAIRFTDTTDLSNVAGVSAVLYDEAEASDAWYTLQGVRLKEKPSKTGIYLHGGRKVIVK